MDIGIMPAALNPLHYGHIGVMMFSLYFIDELHVYVGKRNRADRLPRELRIACLEETILKENLDRVRITEAEKAIDLDGSLYQAFVGGSDFLNVLFSEDNLIRERYTPYLASFNRHICVHRSGRELKAEARSYLRDVIIGGPLEDISSTAIRAWHKEKGKIEADMIPDYLHGMILPYASTLWTQDRCA